ncbi:MAG: RNA methyltransferase [Peptoniphilaceae bacterium]|nr:RNA methyltransferase [Peptoniphilaceae bacterium]MDD7383282.1 RNA methyltransferase [Peptoniphilaceae bacterium]MDY3738347.1 RNA methyltransferase [Peptoniphilaceae bacterium]
MIESSSNKLFKNIIKLKQKKYRDKFGYYYIETEKLVKEAMKSSCNIIFVILREDREDFDTLNFEKKVFSNTLFKKMSELKNPDGVGAIIKIKESKNNFGNRIILLDNIQDPGNAGTIIRSSEAFGFSDVLIYNDGVDLYNLKTLRASMGSAFRVNVRDVNLNDVVELKNKYKLYASDMGGKDVSSLKISETFILAVGNEANGLSDEIIKLSDSIISIPMKGKIESLNAAVAASILMHELNQ